MIKSLSTQRYHWNLKISSVAPSSFHGPPSVIKAYPMTWGRAGLCLWRLRLTILCVPSNSFGQLRVELNPTSNLIFLLPCWLESQNDSFIHPAFSETHQGLLIVNLVSVLLNLAGALVASRGFESVNKNYPGWVAAQKPWWMGCNHVLWLITLNIKSFWPSIGLKPKSHIGLVLFLLLYRAWSLTSKAVPDERWPRSTIVSGAWVDE